jgi:type II secretory pathway pseudopilin PulG
MNYTLKKALTMIEILLAVALIAMLAAGMFFVGGKVREQANVRHTESTLAMLDTALEQYYDFDKSYPPDVNYAGPGNSRDLRSAMAMLPTDADPCVSPVTTGYGIYNDACSVEVLYYYLNRVPQSRAVLSRLPESSISAKAVKLDTTKKPLPSRATDPSVVIAINGKNVGLFRVIDAWNMPLQYIRYRDPANLGVENMNFPQLRSAGPDRVFGTKDDIVNKKN